MYNRELRSEGIEITQFTLLMALDLTGEVTQGKLGQLLALDSTTLTRMLRLLEKRGWIKADVGDDRRQRLLDLTLAGRKKLQKSRPHWNRGQEHLRIALGENTWRKLSEVLGQVTRVGAEK